MLRRTAAIADSSSSKTRAGPRKVSSWCSTAPIFITAPSGARLPKRELEVTLQAEPVRVIQGQRGQIRASIRNRAASEIRGEAQILSPHETWTAITPWTQGFVVPPGGETVVTFAVQPPLDGTAGGYWALLKVMYFGRLFYSESIPVEIEALKVATRRVATASRSR